MPRRARKLSDMLPAKKTSVFIGRETMVNLDEFQSIQPSTDSGVGLADDWPLVTSDIVDRDYAECDNSHHFPESMGSERTLSVSLRASESKKDRPRPSKFPDTSRKCPQTGHNDSHETFPRRSTRIRAIASTTKPAPRIVAATKTGKRQAKRQSHASSRNQSGEWEIDKIVDSRIDKDTLKHFFLVKWKGFASKDNTWEPKTNLTRCWAAIKAYEKGAK